MANAFDSATQQELAARLRFYRDLGLTELYRRPVDAALLEKLKAAAETAATAPEPQTTAEPAAPVLILEEVTIPPRK